MSNPKNTYSLHRGWQYLRLRCAEGSLLFQVDVVMNSPSILYFPDDESWLNIAPAWAKDKRSSILEYIRSHKLGKILVIEEIPVATMRDIIDDH